MTQVGLVTGRRPGSRQYQWESLVKIALLVGTVQQEKAGPSISCIKYDEKSKLTNEDTKSIVDRINSRRNFIALGRSKKLPGAGNMRKIVWSDELAIFAQRWADQCDLSRPHKEDYCRNLVQRLVCNFAPKGNVKGKPVYLIGYPATQCPDNMVPDFKYKGLCNKIQLEDDKQTSRTPGGVRSLLRIINLSNNTDLFRNNKITNKIKSRKLTTISMNNTHAAVKRYPQHNFWEKPINQSKVRDHNNHQLENPWRVFHGLDAPNNLNMMNKKIESGPQKFDSIYSLTPFNKQDSLKLKQEPSCTRKTNLPFTKDPLRSNCDNEKIAECTRGYKNECWTQTNQNIQATSPFLYSICSCDSYTTTTQRTTSWIGYCQCLKNNPQIICSNSRRTQDEFTNVVSKNSGTFQHYDLLPNLHLRERIGRENVPNKLSTHVPAKERLDLVNINKRKENNPFYRQVIKHIRDLFILILIILIVSTWNFRQRHKRNDPRYTTLMPFWQMDDTMQKKTSQFKTAVRYTTLSSKQLKHTKMKTGLTSIEPITLMTVTTNLNRELPSITEKYLSFDELMQLRNKGVDARRQGIITKESTIAATTKEITANTPFVRMKHCTRKLTCTWTITQMTDCNGSVIIDNDPNNRGSRTPPGYVDGCTRTSTCTRDYMDRNKLVASTEETDDTVTTTEIDDDYCERRSLDVRRRNSRGQAIYNNKNIDKLEFLDDSSKKKLLTTTLLNREERKDKDISDCFCYNLSGRAKRDDTRNKNYPLIYKRIMRKSGRNHNENLYYGDLYYKVLSKIKQTWEKNKKGNLLGKCLCNGNRRDNYYSLELLILSCSIIFT
ncbi:Venom allergen 5 [Papilio xuthus]|uniref:Venom allergen 5 n=1 Tax=Papilio xuthus TaxID=66420 RepID=A0A194QHC2_PAPXU|nr:Venom allergen 5 [Papilio xuthus]